MHIKSSIDLMLLRGCQRHPEPAEPWRDRLGLPAVFRVQGLGVKVKAHIRGLGSVAVPVSVQMVEAKGLQC